MEIGKNVFIMAGIVTLLLFGLIFVANELLNNQRQSTLNDMRDEVLDEIENMKAFTAVSTLIGQEENCNILQSQLRYFDKSLWDLGIKLDSYEEASRNIFDNPFYKQQKKRFIINQILYLSMFEQMKSTCNTSKPVTVIYFYANSKDCKQCDDQSFVLTDIKKEDEAETAVFSLDMDIDVVAVQVLADYYNITKPKLPCTIIEGQAYCGLIDKKEVLDHICKKDSIKSCA